MPGDITTLQKAIEENKLPKKFQLELIGTESDDRLDKKICPWDAIKMYEFDEGPSCPRISMSAKKSMR